MALKAHVGYSIPHAKDLNAVIVSHFCDLGYQGIKQSDREWVFTRGSKLAVLWRFNIRAYFTSLTVRARPQSEGGFWISCDWEVYTLMSIITGGDIQTLEAEGRALESALRT